MPEGKTKLELALGVFQAVVIALATLYFSDRVANAIKQRELDLANIKEMRELLLDIQGDELTLPRARADAAGLAAFGPYAVVPFVNLMQEVSDNKMLAAEAGLRSLALSHPEPVATQMERIIKNRSRFYNWRTHLFAIQLLGEMEWKSALWTLQQYEPLVAEPDSVAAERLSAIMRPEPPLVGANASEMRSALVAAIQSVRD